MRQLRQKRAASKPKKAQKKTIGARVKLAGVQDLLKTIQALRHPKTGCPWDLAQTHESLMKYFFEELHEFNDALMAKGPNDPGTVEELGDVLLQIVLHAELMSEQGTSDFDELSARLAAKIRRRHPHVFDPKFRKFKSPEEVSAAWESIKASTKSQPTFDRMFSDVPKTLPALTRAARLGEKAASLGFDWPKADDVLDKIIEEVQELKESLQDDKNGPQELGDLLFACAQLARLKGWDPEQALKSCEQKFVKRLTLMNQQIESQNLKWQSLNLVALETLWQQTKKLTPNT